jgi:hypothetical protein
MILFFIFKCVTPKKNQPMATFLPLKRALEDARGHRPSESQAGVGGRAQRERPLPSRAPPSFLLPSLFFAFYCLIPKDKQNDKHRRHSKVMKPNELNSSLSAQGHSSFETETIQILQAIFNRIEP